MNHIWKLQSSGINDQWSVIHRPQAVDRTLATSIQIPFATPGGWWQTNKQIAIANAIGPTSVTMIEHTNYEYALHIESRDPSEAKNTYRKTLTFDDRQFHLQLSNAPKCVWEAFFFSTFSEGKAK